MYYGCENDKFGGCGSILSLHFDSPGPQKRFISDPNPAVESSLIGQFIVLFIGKLVFFFFLHFFYQNILLVLEIC